MNSLKLIDKLIMDHKINIDIHKGILLIDDSKKFFHNKVIKENEESINVLRQIKSELEAWYELNKLFVIKPYYQDKENNKHPAIMIQHRVEHDFEYVRRGVKQESFDIIEKALEVEDNA